MSQTTSTTTTSAEHGTILGHAETPDQVEAKLTSIKDEISKSIDTSGHAKEIDASVLKEIDAGVHTKTEEKKQSAKSAQKQSAPKQAAKKPAEKTAEKPAEKKAAQDSSKKPQGKEPAESDAKKAVPDSSEKPETKEESAEPQGILQSAGQKLVDIKDSLISVLHNATAPAEPTEKAERSLEPATTGDEPTEPTLTEAIIDVKDALVETISTILGTADTKPEEQQQQQQDKK
eukprot:TRINITY_DN12409_c0_g1_i1.p1 TRINITY_DN12409_c0_g1~~TRINITY_DN12409_c0_g1_i1.p1  ORF type:complete len:232 (+),score=106.78 TRINITY_DN12409_c0_g1_i1:50-745(+)